ncbi:HD-GYP domain-containing protein [Candidatus Riflebacteria bacterium]
MRISAENLKRGHYLKRNFNLQGGSCIVANSCLNEKQIGQIQKCNKGFIEIHSTNDLLQMYFNPPSLQFYEQSLDSLRFVFSQRKEIKTIIDLSAIDFIAHNLYLDIQTHPQALFKCMKKVIPQSDEDILIKHCLDTAILSMMLARKSGFPPGEIRVVGICALVHDIGLPYIGEYTESFKFPLHEKDFQELKKHPEYSRYFFEKFPCDSRLYQRIISQHHERLDGTGYPKALKNEEILPLSQVLALAEIFDALIRPNPKREALSPKNALHLIYREYEKKFTLHFLNALIETISFFPPSENLCIISNGKSEEVEVINWTNNLYRPLVLSKENQKILNLCHPENQKIKLVAI